MNNHKSQKSQKSQNKKSNIPQKENFMDKEKEGSPSKRLKFYNDDGEMSELYHTDFNADELGDYVLDIRDDDPRKKLEEMIRKQALEALRSTKKPIAKYSDKDRLKDQKAEEEPLPVNPDIIVVPRDPKNKDIDEHRRKIKKISDVPRRNMIFKRDPDYDLYFKQLKEQCHDKDEYNNIMLINEINMRHPRIFDNHGFPKKYSICDGFGFFGWISRFLFTEYSKFGEGLNDYFRLLKINIIFFLISSIFSILLLLYYGNDKKLFKKDTTEIFGYSKLRDIFTRYTLSNILMNNYYLYDVININGQKINYTFSCPTSENDNKTFQVYKDSIVKCYFFSKQMSKSDIESSMSNLVNYQRYEKVKPEIKDYWENITGIKKSIICEKDYSSCTIDFSKYNELIIPNHTVSQIQTILFQYQCVYNHNGIHSDKTNKIFLTLNYIMVLILIGYIYLLFIVHWYSQLIHFENYYQTNQYTVYIKGIDLSPTPPKLYIELNTFLQTITNAAMFQRTPDNESDIGDNYNTSVIYESCNAVYQMSYSLFDYNILDLTKEKRDLLSQYEVPNYYNIKANAFTSAYINNKYNLEFDGDKKYETLAKIKVYNNHIHLAENNKDNMNINDIFITFKTKGHAEKCYNCYHSKNCLYRMLIYILCRKNDIKPFYYKEKWLDVELMPPEKDGLQYENLRYPYYLRIPRIFFSYFVIIVFVFVSLVCYFQGVKSVRRFNKTYKNYINCNHVSKVMTYSTIYDEFNSNNQKQINTFCLCKYYYLTEGKKKAKEFYITLDDSGIYDDYSYNGNVYVYPCLDWLKKMDHVNNTYLWIYIVTAIINIITLRVIPYLAIIERHKTIMKERVNAFFYSFICGLFINCLNPLLSHANISLFFSEKVSFFPIFTGDQISYNPEWYYYVSSTVMMNIMIGIIVPYLIDYIKWAFFVFVRKCLCKKILIKKNKYLFLFWFIGPECRFEIKIGFQLSLFCSCLICNFYTTNPIAMFSMALLSFIHFYLDKILFINYYKNPFTYNQDINQLYMKILYFFIMIGVLVNAYQVGLFYLHVPDMLSIKQQLYIMIKSPVIFCFIIFIGLMIFVPLIYYNLMPCLIYLTCKKRDVAYGFAMDEAFEETCMVDFTIYESLPLSILYKNYVIRKLEYAQISKFSLDTDLTFLMRYYRQRLDTDRAAIAEKLEAITGKICALDENFDSKIKYIMENLLEDDETKIKGNYSYNMSYFDVYETLYLNEMLKN